nr:RcnB family protein [Sphingomonas naasensis]
MHRGGTLPGFWREQDFRIDDYLSFGLAAPPHGYGWVRYYDDAVLVDRDGRVWDSIDGIAWGGAAASASAGLASAESRAGLGAPYPAPRIEPVDPDDYYYDDGPRRHDMPPSPPPFAEPAPYHGPYPGGYAPSVAPPPMVQMAPACPQFCGGWQGGYSGMTWQNGAWVGNYGAGTTVVVIPGATTTTTVTEYVERVSTRTWRRPTKRLVRKRVSCGCR